MAGYNLSAAEREVPEKSTGHFVSYAAAAKTAIAGKELLLWGFPRHAPAYKWSD